MEINSVSNEKIKYYSKLSEAKYRNSEALFIVEGEKALEDIISSGVEIKDIFATADKINFDGNFTKVSENVMKKLSTSDSVPKILTVAKKPQRNINALKNVNKALLLEEISDPGNLGTIIRSAVAFGFEAIILYGNCVDEFNPKVIRSSAGNFFKIKIYEVKNLDNPVFKEFEFLTTNLHKPSILPRKAYINGKYILAAGSEAKGLTIDFSGFKTQNILIKTEKVESLNLGVSVSLLMYELSMKSD